VLDLGGSHPERERAEGTVRRGVAVAAHDRHPRLRQAELRTDDVDDALATATGRVQRDPEFRAVRTQRVELSARERVRHSPGEGRDVVIHRRNREIRPANAAAGKTEPVERLRRGDLVDQVQIDVEQRRPTRLLADDVALPDPVEKRLGHERERYRSFSARMRRRPRLWAERFTDYDARP